MPLLLDCRRLVIEFADFAHRRNLPVEKELPRYPGAHQSDILQHVAREHLRILKPGERLEEDYPERMLMGKMFEEMYFSLPGVTDAQWQPGEVVVDETDEEARDGIAVNCDGIGILPNDQHYVELGVNEDAFLEETKCTEKKLKSGEQFLEDWMWMHQGRAYCYAYGPRLVRWSIWYYRGDWRGSGPVCMQYLVRFSDQECEATWAMLSKFRLEAMSAIAVVRAGEQKENAA